MTIIIKSIETDCMSIALFNCSENISERFMVLFLFLHGNKYPFFITSINISSE